MPQLRQIKQVRDGIIQAMFAGIPPENESMFKSILARIHKKLSEEAS